MCSLPWAQNTVFSPHSLSSTKDYAQLDKELGVSYHHIIVKMELPCSIASSFIWRGEIIVPISKEKSYCGKSWTKSSLTRWTPGKEATGTRTTTGKLFKIKLNSLPVTVESGKKFYYWHTFFYSIKRWRCTFFKKD